MDMARQASELPYTSSYGFERGGNTGVYNYTSGPAMQYLPYGQAPFYYPPPNQYRHEETAEGYAAPTAASKAKGSARKPASSSRRAASPARDFPTYGAPPPFFGPGLHAPLYSTHYGAAPVGYAGTASPRGSYY